MVDVGFGFCEALIYRGELLVHFVPHVGEALVGVGFGFCEALIDLGKALVSIVFGFCESLVDSVESLIDLGEVLVDVVLHVGEALVNIVFGFSRILHNNFSEVAESQIKRGNLIGDCLKMSVNNQMLTLQLVAQVSHGDDAVLRTAWCGGGLGHGHWLYHSYESCQVNQSVDIRRSVCAATPKKAVNFSK